MAVDTDLRASRRPHADPQLSGDARVRGRGSGAARLSPSHPLQHILDSALGAHELLRITGTQNHIGVGAALWIEERIAADRDFWIGPSDVAELHADVALARIRAHRVRERANASLELVRHVEEHRLL